MGQSFGLRESELTHLVLFLGVFSGCPYSSPGLSAFDEQLKRTSPVHRYKQYVLFFCSVGALQLAALIQIYSTLLCLEIGLT